MTGIAEMKQYLNLRRYVTIESQMKWHANSCRKVLDYWTPSRPVQNATDGGMGGGQATQRKEVNG